MSIHLQQYRSSSQYTQKEEGNYVYMITRYYQEYAHEKTVCKLTFKELSNDYFSCTDPYAYGEPPLDSKEAQTEVAIASRKIQDLYKKLVNDHKEYKVCTYSFHTAELLLIGMGEKIYLSQENDIRLKRKQLKEEFLQTIPKLKAFFNEKGGAYLLEKVCHIATEIICSIAQDADFLKRYSEEIANSPEGKTRKTINLLKKEYSQLAERFGNLLKISQLLNHQSEFDLGNEKKCFFPRRSISKIKDLISEISIHSWAAETFKSFKSGLSDLFASKESDSDPVQPRISPIYLSNTSDSDSDDLDFWEDLNRRQRHMNQISEERRRINNITMTGNPWGIRY